MEDNMVIPEKIKYIITMWSYNFTSGCIRNKVKVGTRKDNVYTHGHNSIILYSLKG